MKKNILFAVFAISIFWFACGGGEKSGSSDNASYTSASVDEGEKLFKQYCILCHGVDGKLGLNGAKDLTVSILTFDERVDLIKNGKNTMTPFEGILTKAQMESAAKYSMTFSE